jgi:3-dehydroquinate dehydratase II
MTEKTKIQVIHGPNLNLLGTREESIYGNVTLDEINFELKKVANKESIQLNCFQSNHEGEIVDKIQSCISIGGIVINPAAYTHTSIAIRDALLAINKPFVEVHLSDINKRESFRQHSYFSDIALKVICGQGPDGYYQGLDFLIKHLTS